jgi:sporulation protein YlmC with PRC-barrel domain
MRRALFVGSMVASCCIGLTAPLLAEEPAVSSPAAAPSAGDTKTSATMLSKECLSDLRTFDDQLRKDGYWLDGSGYGYGYPMGEMGYGYGYPLGGAMAATGTGYLRARPGYEVRVLVAAANILARQGQAKPCEDVLAASRDTYAIYAAEMHSGNVPMAEVARWREEQIATAQPVANAKTPFRSDELLGTDVRDSKSKALGSVHDLVMAPGTGKIAYLVIARGGIFGFDATYVPVPWDDFKITTQGSYLVLDTTKEAMDAAPQETDSQFTSAGHFDQDSQKVDSYWKTHLSIQGKGGTNG